MSTPQSNEIYKDPPDFVVKIWHGAAFFGTGVLLRKNLVLTAAHCINPDFEPLKNHPDFNGPFASKGDDWRFELVIESKDGKKCFFKNVEGRANVGQIKGNYTHDIVLIEILNSEFKLSTRVQLLGNIGSEEWNAQVIRCRAYAVGHRPNSEQGADYMYPQVQVQPCPNTNAHGAVNFSFNTSLVSGQSGSGIVVPNLKRNGCLILGIACLSGKEVNFCNCCGHADILALLTDDSGPFSKEGLVCSWREFISAGDPQDLPELRRALEEILRKNARLSEDLKKAFNTGSGDVAELARTLVLRVDQSLERLSELLTEPDGEIQRAIRELADVLLPFGVPVNLSPSSSTNLQPRGPRTIPEYQNPIRILAPGVVNMLILDAIVARLMDRKICIAPAPLAIRFIAGASDMPADAIHQILEQLWERYVASLTGKTSPSGRYFAERVLTNSQDVAGELRAIRQSLEAAYKVKLPLFTESIPPAVADDIARTLKDELRLLLILFENPSRECPEIEAIFAAAMTFQSIQKTT